MRHLAQLKTLGLVKLAETLVRRFAILSHKRGDTFEPIECYTLWRVGRQYEQTDRSTL